MLIETENHSWKRVPDVMLRDARLKLSDVAVFACLLDLCKDILQVSVSRQEIAKRISRTCRAVTSSLNVLEKYGYIERKINVGYATTYVLAELVPAEKKRKRKPTSQPDSLSEQQPDSSQEQRERLGKYQHVTLTKTERQTLERLHGSSTVKRYIEKIDEYCELYDKAYKNYYLAMKKWIEGDKQKSTKAFAGDGDKFSDEELQGYLQFVNHFEED